MAGYKDDLIVGICKKLQLPARLYEQANDRYRTISEILSSDGAFKSIDVRMYAQGSFRLMTTVKPLHKNEFDLDFVVDIPSAYNMTPRELYEHIYRILTNDGIHNDMVERKSRCIRLNYANDFHMDIMPGKKVDEGTNEIIVPDRELSRWYHHSNPIGYADWFENQAKDHIRYYLKTQRSIRASVEPIQDQEIAEHLEPLRRAVQLVKRYRDVYCEANNKEPVRSIVICTLLGEISGSYSSEICIIRDFCNYVNAKIQLANGTPFEVKNPVVDEILSEKWKEDRRNYFDFVDMMDSLTDDIRKLDSLSLNTEITEQLKRMFGEKITNIVVRDYSQKMTDAREREELAIDSKGILNTRGDGIKVKKNTFYGQ